MDLKISSMHATGPGENPLIPDYQIAVTIGDKEVPLIITHVSYKVENGEAEPTLHGLLNLGPFPLLIRVIPGRGGPFLHLIKQGDQTPVISGAELITENMEGQYANYRLHFSSHDSILVHTLSIESQRLTMKLKGRVHLDGIPLIIECILYPQSLSVQESEVGQKSYIAEINFCN